MISADKRTQNNFEQLAQEAMTQIHEKKYYAGLTGETVLWGIAHSLKRSPAI